MKGKESNKEEQKESSVNSMLVCMGIMKRSKQDYKDVNVIGSFAIRKEKLSDRDMDIVKDPKDQSKRIYILPPSSLDTCLRVNSCKRFVLTIPGSYGVIFSCELVHIINKFHVDAFIEFPDMDYPGHVCRLEEMNTNSERTRLIFNEHFNGSGCHEYEVR